MHRSRIGAIVLAAGSSSRLGTPKQLLRFDGTSLLRRATLAALDAGCDPVVVVTGAHVDIYRGELAGLAVHEAFNAEWETGLASSIRVGIAALAIHGPDVAAVLLLLCDQPHVTASVLSRLIDAHLAIGRGVVASAYGDTAGTPALFARAHFDELARIDGAAGAKQIIARHASEAQLVPFPLGDVDVDTPADAERLALSPAAGRP